MKRNMQHIALLFVILGTTVSRAETGALVLWYEKPATTWVEALPTGNGRLGAMVFGGVGEERIQLNEETIWAGPPVPEPNDGSASSCIAAADITAQLPNPRRLVD